MEEIGQLRSPVGAGSNDHMYFPVLSVLSLLRNYQLKHLLTAEKMTKKHLSKNSTEPHSFLSLSAKVGCVPQLTWAGGNLALRAPMRKNVGLVSAGKSNPSSDAFIIRV